MLLSKKTSIKVSQEYANVIGHMCYAASKLWNVCNYERQHYKEMGMEKYPEIRQKLWKGQLWNHSYYVETIGSVSEENIRRYIEHQSKSY